LVNVTDWPPEIAQQGAPFDRKRRHDAGVDLGD
jgi:hypothetical protein